MRSASALAFMTLFSLGTPACNASPSAADACISTGGQCVVATASASCARRGSSDCSSSAAGAFCCLEFLDAAGEGAAVNRPDANSAGCAAPDAATYSCPAQPLDAGGCPAWEHRDGATDSYPVGCIATVPQCSVFSNYTSAQTCDCEGLFDAGPQWVCPL